MRPRLAAIAAAFLALALALGAPAGGAPTASAQTASMNHAAIVIDTGDGQVRKLCLAFPEAEIQGIEALQRVDTRPNRFAAYGTMGSGVCMLCGVGCPSGDCFCNPQKFWAYHRAGPGGERYTASRAGASSTRVRDGDVEGWKWGGGEAPPAATVSEVCDVPEPPARTSASGTTSTTSAASPTSSTEVAAPTTSPPAPTSSVPPGSPAPRAPGGPVAPPPTATPATTLQPEVAADEGGDPANAASPTKRTTTTPAGSAAGPRPAPEATPGGGWRPSDAVGLVAFAGLLAAVLAWRARLRRANVRRVTAVR